MSLFCTLSQILQVLFCAIKIFSSSKGVVKYGFAELSEQNN